MIVVTGATGQLGRLIIQALLKTQPASEIVCCSSQSGEGRRPRRVGRAGPARRL